VRRISADDDCVTVRSDDMTIRALWVIVAVPLAIASHIVYEPMLPVEREFLHQRMPTGSIIKTSIVYDAPLWRADGLSGQSAAPDSPATVTLDACTDTGNPGVLCVIVEGPIARYLGIADAADRRQDLGDELEGLRSSALERLEEKRAEIEEIRDEVRVDAADFDLPEIPEPPEPEIDEDDRPEPLCSSEWDFAEQCAALIALKNNEVGG
jgi:hypothetical protein